MSERALKVLASADAVLTAQPGEANIKDFYRSIVTAHKQDTDERKFNIEAIYKTVLLFVSNEDFASCLDFVATE